MRAGGYALTLLGVPLNICVLEALATGSKPLADLRREAGSPPPTTMRAHLRTLADLGVIEKQRENDFPGDLVYTLGRSGHDLLSVAGVLGGWLAISPCDPLALGSVAAKSAVKALTEGWSSTLLRALAARPLSPADLDRLVAGISYPSLVRRLGAMRHAGQVEVRPGNGGGRPYAVTSWLRQAVGPLAAATRWERTHVPERTAPVGRIDTEALFLLAAPLLRLPAELRGSCRLVMEIANDHGPRFAGVVADVVDGRVDSCTVRLEGNADAWASGSASALLHALVAEDTDRLEIGGDCGLAYGLLEALHGNLFTTLRMSDRAAR